jgi:hypothetical protein
MPRARRANTATLGATISATGVGDDDEDGDEDEDTADVGVTMEELLALQVV